jgi:serine/threonine protein kinase
VAVKEFPAAASALPAAQQAAILREVELLAKVNHAHVLRFYGYCPDPLCIVTERCANDSVYAVLQRARGDAAAAAALTWPRRLGFALDAAKGMAYLHSLRPPILHRDLKSPNLLVTEHWRCKVGDLGLSKVASDVAASTAGGKSLGADNPRWMAPEVMRSRAAAAAASDVFSFGVVLWELLTWQEPWTHLGDDDSATAVRRARGGAARAHARRGASAWARAIIVVRPAPACRSRWRWPPARGSQSPRPRRCRGQRTTAPLAPGCPATWR